MQPIVGLLLHTILVKPSFPAVKTNNDKRYWFHSGGAVASNGDIYFAAAVNKIFGDVHIDVLKSTDKGKTWNTIRVDTSKARPRVVRWMLLRIFGTLPVLLLILRVNFDCLQCWQCAGGNEARTYIDEW
jgi:hypothetical protein